jgi:RNA-directed DNA polymerase
VISPLLANVYLHYVFDLWVEAWRKKVARGQVIVVRYADDLVVGFQYRADAELFLQQFGERLAKFGLELHPEKTRLLEFGRFAAVNRRQRGEKKPETFTFLGFVHQCGTDPRGRFMVWRQTANKRMVAKLRQIKLTLRRRMHEPVPRIGAWLRSVLQGFYRYHAVPGNLRALSTFRHRLGQLWRNTLRHRSQRSHVSWERLGPLSARWLPAARVLHPYPSIRFDATHPR